MPNTHDVGPFFFHGIRLRPRTPLIHRAVTDELDPPFRNSNSIVVRFFRWGIVLGRWRVTGREEDEMFEVVGGREDALSTEQVRETRRFDWKYQEEQAALREDDDDYLVA